MFGEFFEDRPFSPDTSIGLFLVFFYGTNINASIINFITQIFNIVETKLTFYDRNLKFFL